ncbi:MAG: nuclease-related domain-containing protein, partial [Woeseiaceae bacterium]
MEFDNLEALGLLFLVIIALAGAYFRSSTARGARGERRVATTLRRQLSDDQYDLFHDITLDSSRGPTQIDHIVVSRYGVFVIETKNYSGWIFGDAASRHWTQVLYRKKYRFMNPLRQNYKHVEAVKSLLGLSDQFIFSVVVFVGKADFKTVLPDNVVYRHELGGLIRSKNDPVLSAAEVESIV